jgi:hypothetical protein
MNQHALKGCSLIIGTLLLSTTALADEPSFTKGAATKVTNAGLLDCGARSRISAMGEITSEDGKVWTVPAANNFQTAPKASDLFNECGGQELDSVADLKLQDVPVADAGGEEVFTAYLFADNYFELYVNGKLIAVDPVPFTPFNSNVVRFKAERPLSIAVKMIDWEEILGLGMESNRGTKFHPGDGGLVAQFQDASGKTIAITDANWKAQTFYTAPIVDRSCLVVDGAVRDSSACDKQTIKDAASTSAAHWAVPEDWMQPSFDDSGWPAAVTYTNNTVGVDNKKSYTNFVELFDAKDADAEFIWSSNLVLDNLVLLRTVIE